MAAVDDEAAFTFSWRALRLLGRGLYSNPWSALSELVANGIDARAEDVYVYVDARTPSNATVEVIDSGFGMSRQDIDNYVKVGHDKRKATSAAGGKTDDTKGRKGIGKLAALFLSQHFYLSTRHANGESSWELDAREGKVDEDAYPILRVAATTPSTINDELWSTLVSGTRISMLRVDLTGYGTQAVKALGARLANQFILPINSSPRVHICVQTRPQPPHPLYQQVEKNIAYNNLSQVLSNFPDTALEPPDLASPAPNVSVPAKGLKGDVVRRVQVRGTMLPEPQMDEAWSQIATDVDPQARKYRGVSYVLSGWIGVHATINGEVARTNDSRFAKNKYYNPAQIRVYVRGKLATDRLLSQLGLTGTYVNYIEGEISFDLLDDDSLPDIATSNRQDFDETDKRVTLLRALVRPLVRNLIQGRNALAAEIADEQKKEKERREIASKRNFSDQLRADLDHHMEIPQPTRDELQMVITNKIRGDVLPKQSYRVFISHSSSDRPFVRFVDEILRARGANTDEIFFTSRTGSTEILTDERALSEVVKRNITEDNTLIFYMTSKNFLKSQFCLFEGGAGWATRSVSEYLKLNVEYASIPTWLTDGRGEAVLLGSDNSIELTPELHNYLIDGVLNPMISHLNRGREIADDPLIPLFTRTQFPSSVEMSRAGKTAREYFDPLILEHWAAVVEWELAAYLSDYLGEE